MTVTASTFRSSLTEFSSTAIYPDSAVNFWLGIAGLLLPVQTWGAGAATAVSPPTSLLDYGVTLFAAHMIAIESQNQRVSAAGGIPGLTKGPVSSESVGGVSRSYDVAAGIVENAGHWNLTNYGVRFIQLARLIGRGPTQVGADCIGGFGGAWFGPPVFPNGYW